MPDCPELTDRQKRTLYEALKRQIPVLRGPLREQFGQRTVEVYCPYCDCRHLHEWPEGYGIERVVRPSEPHCFKGSPLRNTGYLVGLDSSVSVLDVM